MLTSRMRQRVDDVPRQQVGNQLERCTSCAHPFVVVVVVVVETEVTKVLETGCSFKGFEEVENKENKPTAGRIVQRWRLWR